MTNSQHNHHEEEHVGHIVPVHLLAAVAVTLLIATAVTVYTAKYVDLGRFNIWLALFLAFSKATIVCLFFMHLKWDSKFNALVLISSCLFVFLFIGLALTDTEEYQPQIQKWAAQEEPLTERVFDTGE